MAKVGQVDRFGSTLDAIVEIGRNETVIAMEKQAKADFAAGSIAVTQGATLSEIDKEEPWYNQTFGPSATMRGAEAQTAVQGTNEYFASEAAFLSTDEGRALTTKQYRDRQTNNLKSILTGNSRIDSMLTQSITPKMGALAEAQTKANRAYVNEQNVLHVGNRILGEAKNVTDLAASNGWDHQLVGEAKTTLGQSLQNAPPGMNADSWRQLLVQSVVVNYKQGSEVMHLSTQAMGIQFTPKEQLSILEAQRGFASGQDTQLNLDAENAWGKIAAGVDQGDLGPEELQDRLAEYGKQFGDLQERGSRALFRKAYGKQDEEESLSALSDKVLRGDIGLIVNEKDKQAALQHAYKRINARYDETPDGKAAARRDRITIWSKGAVQDKALRSKFTYLTGGLNETGKVDQRYVEHFTDWQDYFAADPVKALDLITGDEAKAQAETVATLLLEGSAGDVASAVRMVDSQRKRNTDSGYLNSPDFTEDLDEAIEEIASSKWSWFGFQTPQEAVANTGAIKGFVSRKARELVARGYDMKTAVSASAKTFARNHDIINGVDVYNAGKPMAEGMQLRQGAGTAEEAINLYMGQRFNRQPDEFRVVGMDRGIVRIHTSDPDNIDYIDTVQEFNLREIGLHANNGVWLQTQEALVVDGVRRATESHRRKVSALRKRRQALGLPNLSIAGLNAKITETQNERAAQRVRRAQILSDVGSRVANIVDNAFGSKSAFNN